MQKETQAQSQNALILAHLRAGKGISQLQAYDLFGCTRLAARIHNIRRQLEDANTGESIVAVSISFTARSGVISHYSRYYLKKS